MYEFKLFDFYVYNKYIKGDPDKDNNVFTIQMFGLNELGETASITVNDFKPFLYILVDDTWEPSDVPEFIGNIKTIIGEKYDNSIIKYRLEKKHKLYGFDNKRTYPFVYIEVENTIVLNKIKNLYYEQCGARDRRLKKNGLEFNNTNTQLYEMQVPPLLRFFHINEISPSGWISVNPSEREKSARKRTVCKYEYNVSVEKVTPLPEKETRVPFKICSYDIEASSSHGDFPLPIKDYQKLAHNIVHLFDREKIKKKVDVEKMLEKAIMTAFNFDNCEDIDIIYTKKTPSKTALKKLIKALFEIKPADVKDIEEKEKFVFLDLNREDEEMDEQLKICDQLAKDYKKKETLVAMFDDSSVDKETRLKSLHKCLNKVFEAFPVEGDKVTFIGSTFLNYGEEKPHFNHCIVLGDCDNIDAENTEIQCCKTEQDVLLAWKDIINKEDPDIIIGYNIFGFDYNFMFKRSQELGCDLEFLKMSRNKNEKCYTENYRTKERTIEESSVILASGQYDLKHIKMNGRLQIDLYTHFRKDFNFTSYKLDSVSGLLISDKVKSFKHGKKTTKIFTGNLTGLDINGYVKFDILNHSTESYKQGTKFKVIDIDYKEKSFTIDSVEKFDEKQYMNWGLAKDDVTPQDIFRMTNEGPKSKAVIAKYCIQDCNLVHQLFTKIDVLTSFTEMAKICSVPISFLVFRGQGIKLTSYIGKKCREKDTLMPMIDKGTGADGFEGAIVLEPKCNLYLDNPVACVDYSSLYPSSIISENISHDSKVWTKTYDLNGNILKNKTWGERDKKGNFIYDNLPGYKYINITYDTFKYVRKTPKAAATKVKSGYKVCRFAQFPEEQGKAIMPSILEELLKSRKATKKQMAKEEDPFLKNVLDKRQNSIKITANSLYGQTGAKTSSFYEVDVAASTTATGRKLLTYAKRLIEEVYGDKEVDTKYGKMRSKAEYIYGDTDSVFFTFNFETLDGEKVRGKKALEMTIDLAQEAGALATSQLKNPHDLEYEKTFMPFCLLSKKRYVGMLYELDPEKGKRKSMGIVLKRRDNAPIVKDVYGGIIDILMKEKSIDMAKDFLKKSLQEIIDKKVSMDKLVISKSLRSNYKNPQQIAHNVLAQRIGKRDPGNKPNSGDRIPYVYIQTGKKALQGEKIESPQFIIDNHIKIDYSFYISNQIMKPVLQIFALVLYDMKEFTRKKNGFIDKLDTLRENLEPDKYEKKAEDLKNKEVKAILFDPYLRKTDNEKAGNKEITSFFK